MLTEVRSQREQLMNGVILRSRFVDIQRTAPVRTGQVNTMPSAEIVRPNVLTIEEYLRRRLKPIEGVIPQLAGIDMHGNSIPTDIVGGDVFEYINFQQRYNIEARIARAQLLSKEYLEPLPKGAEPRNEVDVNVQWLSSRPSCTDMDGPQYRKAKSLDQLRIAENLQALYSTAVVLLVDAQGHGVIAAKIASTVHDIRPRSGRIVLGRVYTIHVRRRLSSPDDSSVHRDYPPATFGGEP